MTHVDKNQYIQSTTYCYNKQKITAFDMQTIDNN